MMHALNAGSELIVNQIFREYANEKISRVVCTYEKFSNHYFFDPPLDTTTMVPYSDILNALVFLDTNGYFVAEESVTTYCVECFAMGLNLVGRCPSCGSGKIKRGRVLAHKCGCHDFEELYRQADGWSCPSCKKRLYVAGADYTDEGMRYKCVSCGSIFEKYSTNYQCPECMSTYAEGDEPSVNFKLYMPTRFAQSKKHQIRTAFRINEMVGNYLAKMGYDIRMFFLQEHTGEPLYWDLVATHPTRKTAGIVGVSVLPVADIIDKETFQRIVSKKKRAGLSSAVVVSPARIDSSAILRLSQKGVYVIDTQDQALLQESEIEKQIAPLLLK
jgi:hypothetical protein